MGIVKIVGRDPMRRQVSTVFLAALLQLVPVFVEAVDGECQTILVASAQHQQG